MTYFEAVSRVYKKGFVLALVTLPLFVPLLLVAIQPHWPKNIIGWIIVAVTPVIFEILYLGFRVYVAELKKVEGQAKTSIKKVLKVIPLLLLGVPILVVLFMKFVALLQVGFFEIAP